MRMKKSWGIIALVVILSLAIVGFGYFKIASISGKALLDIYIEQLNTPANIMEGNLKLSIRQGELIPLNSLIVVNQNGIKKQFLLRDLVSSNGEGNYFVENGQISGSGEGFGFIGEKLSYPEVHFSIVLSSEAEKTETPSEIANELTNQTLGEVVEMPVENSSVVSEVSAEIQSPVQVVVEESSEQLSEPVVESTVVEASTTSESSSDDSSSALTGNVISDSANIIEGVVSKDKPFEYETDQDVSVENVYSDYEKLSPSVLKINREGNKVIISTDYSYSQRGFGSEFLGEKKALEIPLEKLSVSPENGSLEISLLYNEQKLAELSKVLGDNGVIKQETNVSEVEGVPQNVTTLLVVQQIKDISIAKDQNYSLNLADYFANAESYSFSSDDFSGSFQDSQLTISAKNSFSNESSAEIVAYSGDESVKQDFKISVSDSNYSVETKKYRIVINRPVKWHKKISVSNEQSISVDLPKEAENISVLSGTDAVVAENQAEQESKSGLLTGEVSFEISKKKGFISSLWSRIVGALTGRVVADISSVTENSENKIVEVQASEDNTLVEYYTPAPTAEEINISEGKRVVISAEDELNYTEILAYSELDNTILMSDKNKIQLYHYNNDSGNMVKENVSFDAYDLDEDGKVDYIEWVVPHLSEQVYEIIYITNAQLLDSARTPIEQVYDVVGFRDGNYLTIPNGDYLRVRFEKNLTSGKDLTVYARGQGNVEVYNENSNDKIGDFAVSGDKEYKIFPAYTNADVYDLLFSGNVAVDYVVDPSGGWCGGGSGCSEYTNSGDCAADANTHGSCVWNSETTISGNSGGYSFGVGTTGSVEVSFTYAESLYYCTDSENSCTPNNGYSSPFTISSIGTTYVRYNAYDSNGNAEAIQSESVVIFDCTNVSGCSGQGSCTAQDVCSCNAGYAGPDCSSYNNDYWCNGHGTYDGASCTCSGNFDSLINCSACSSPYFGLDCSQNDGSGPFLAFNDSVTPADSSTVYNILPVALTNEDNGNVFYSFVNFDNSLVGYWRGEGNTVDSSGNGNTGTWYHNVEGVEDTTPNRYAPGKFGNAFRFVGVGSEGDISNKYVQTSADDFDGNWTISSWINGSRVFLGGNITDAFYVNLANGDITLNLYGAGGCSTSGRDYSTTNWHNVVVMFNGTNYMVYVDNVLGCVGANVGSPTRTTIGGLEIGWYNHGISGGGFNGSIDEVLFFNRTLSTSEIASLYDSYANQYSNNFVVAAGTYSFSGFEVDEAGNIASVGPRSVTLDLANCSGVNSCSGNGNCIGPDVCSCNSGYYGSDCSVACNAATTCSGNGTCDVNGACACTSGYTGTDCLSYDNAYWCSGNGNYNGTACSCNPPYSGDSCQNNLCAGVTCFNSGSCQDNTGLCLCSGNFDSSTNCATCLTGWFGDNCDKCNGRGTEIYSGDAGCACIGNWSGPDYCASCIPGFIDEGNNCGSYNNSYWCNDQGTYNGVSCACNLGFYGSNCSEIDNDAPNVTIVSPVEGSYVGISSGWGPYITCGDGSGSGCSSFYYSYDNSSWQTTDSGGNSIGVPSQGNNTLYVYVIDGAGNVGYATPVSFFYDTQVPTMIINSPQYSSFLNSSSWTSNTTCSDSSGSGCASCEYYYDHIGVGSSAAISMNCNGSDIAAPSEDGNYSLYVRATDVAGNVGDYISSFFIYDTTAPTIDYAEGTTANGDLVLNDIVMNLSVSEANFANATFEVYNESGLVASAYSSDINNLSYTFSELASGNYTFNASVYDLAGNGNSSAVRSATVYSSCLNQCSENDNCIISQDCALNENICSGFVCNFFNMTVGAKVYTLYDAAGNGNNLTINLNGSITFLPSSEVIFSGRNGTQGGNAGIVNISVPDLFNTTRAQFIGVGGNSSGQGANGGNGGQLILNYRGLVGYVPFTGEDPSTSLALEDHVYLNSGNGGENNLSNIFYNRNITCIRNVLERDADINFDGVINGQDDYLIQSNYNARNGTNVNYNESYDINCDNKLNIVELSREGFEWQRGVYA